VTFGIFVLLAGAIRVPSRLPAACTPAREPRPWRRSARDARRNLQLVHRGLRHRRPEGRQGAARSRVVGLQGNFPIELGSRCCVRFRLFHQLPDGFPEVGLVLRKIELFHVLEETDVVRYSLFAHIEREIMACQNGSRYRVEILSRRRSLANVASSIRAEVDRATTSWPRSASTGTTREYFARLACLSDSTPDVMRST
jgi:hypothetical protein